MWSYLSIPKHVVIAWMAILNRLPTMDRLMAWGIGVGGTCRLCLDEWKVEGICFLVVSTPEAYGKRY